MTEALGFGGLLRQLRAAVKLTQEELAEAAGLSPRSVSDLERGINRTARKDTAESLAGALGLAGPVRAAFVAAARGRAAAAGVLAAMDEEARTAAGPEALAVTRGAAWPGCPYLGLMPFLERDARIYYGREELVTDLVRRITGRLGRAGILLVAGESGAGKSSLLRAGLMPRLAAGSLGPGSDRWPRRVIRPGGKPLRELAAALGDVANTDADSVYRSLSAAPAEAPMLVELAVRTATGRGAHAEPGGLADSAAAAEPRLVLVVDQFEELFSAGGDAEADRMERDRFITALHAAASGSAGPRGLPPALVILAIRADFLGRLIAYPPLKAALDAGPFTVGPMSEAELRLAMTGPAAEADLAIEPALVGAAIAELGERAGAEFGSGVLPLISQAMAATWEHREGGELTLRAYRRAGGVAYAVNRSAQAAYYALTDSQQDAARLVFTQLTVLTADGRFERRRCRRTDLRAQGTQIAADVDAVIDIFSAHRLLTLGQDSVEISHDVLFQAWKQLRDWLGGDQLDRALYSQIVTDAFIWDGNGRDPSHLYSPARLATIDAAGSRWRAAPARYAPLPATSTEFLDTAHRAARRSVRERRAVIGGLLALSMIAVSAAGVAVHGAADASRGYAIAQSGQLAAESLAIDATDPMTARRLAVAAWSVSHTGQAGSALAALLTEQQQRGILPADPSAYAVTAVAFSPDGRRLASAGADGTVRLWNPATGQAIGTPLRTVTGTADSADAVAFSPDGTRLASAGSDGTVRLWNPATGREVGAPIHTDSGPGGAVFSVAFSPDGTRLASAGADGTIRLWNPATGREVGTAVHAVARPGETVSGVAFSPDGTLASAGSDGTVRLWDPATGREVGAPMQADSSGRTGHGVHAVAFSPDGTLLASAGSDGTVRLWNPATAAWLRTVTGPGGAVSGVAFSPDGTLLASAHADGTVRLWNPATGKAPGAPLEVVTGTASIPRGALAVAFRLDDMLASAGSDGAVRLWNPATGQAAGALLPAGTGAEGAVRALAFGLGGTLLASVEADGRVRLWKLGTRTPVSSPLLAGSASRVNAMALSPDGKLLAVATGEGIVQLRNPATGLEDGPPLEADPGSPPGVNAVAFSPDGTMVATAGEDGLVRLWSLATRRAVGFPLRAATAPGGTVLEVAFSPDGKLLATADADGTVQLWNPGTHQPAGSPLRAATAPGGAVLEVAFSPDGKLLATADADGTVRIWHVALFSDPYAALCADVGPPTRADWTRYAPGEMRPKVCNLVGDTVKTRRRITRRFPPPSARTTRHCFNDPGYRGPYPAIPWVTAHDNAISHEGARNAGKMSLRRRV